MLVETATAEESQARARRSAFRTIELLGELQEPALLRKFLARSRDVDAGLSGPALLAIDPSQTGRR